MDVWADVGRARSRILSGRRAQDGGTAPNAAPRTYCEPMTSSARSSNARGTETPNAAAVVVLIANA
jgi:hypothetical protein